MANPTLLLRTGSRYKMVCGDCGKVLAKNLSSERAAACHAGIAVSHQATCSGVKLSWLRRLVQAFATN